MIALESRIVPKSQRARIQEVEDTVFDAVRGALLGWSEQLVQAGLRAQLNPVGRADTSTRGTRGYWSEISIWFFAVDGPVESFVDLVEFLMVLRGEECLPAEEVKPLVDEEVAAVIDAYKMRRLLA